MMNKDAFKMMCNAYTDDEVCNACCNNSVMAKQSCYVKPEKLGAERASVTRLYRIIAEDGDVVVLKEVRFGQ